MKPLKLEQSDTINSNKTVNENTKALKLEQSDTTNSNKIVNENTKARTIRCNEQQQKRE
jgi:hypothetical protein